MADTTRLPAPVVAHWEWQLQAACRGMDSSLFFHPANERNTDRENRISAAKKICRQCPAVTACLDHALRAREPYGIWGGLSESERAHRLGVESLRYPALSNQLDNPQLGNPTHCIVECQSCSKYRRVSAGIPKLRDGITRSR